MFALAQSLKEHPTAPIPIFGPGWPFALNLPSQSVAGGFVDGASILRRPFLYHFQGLGATAGAGDAFAGLSLARAWGPACPARQGVTGAVGLEGVVEGAAGNIQDCSSSSSFALLAAAGSLHGVQ